MIQINDVKNTQPDVIQQVMSIYNKIIVQYNIFAPKDIPYRSEAVADFMQANILDEIHGFFIDTDMAHQ